MTLLVEGMVVAGLVILLAGLILARGRVAAAYGMEKIVILGPVFYAAALAIFGAEHLIDPKDVATLVPHWIPTPVFWTYLVGIALIAAAISFIAWKHVRLSAASFALLMLIFVATIHLPNLLSNLHQRLFWTLVLRESGFGAGALVLAGCFSGSRVAVQIGRLVIGIALVFYAVEQFLFPHFAPGVPLQKLTPVWVPAPIVLAYIVGLVFLITGFGLLLRASSLSIARIAAAAAGTVLLLLTAFLYLPIFLMEMHAPLAAEGMNYIGDTLLFAGAVLLAGFDTDLTGTRA